MAKDDKETTIISGYDDFEIFDPSRPEKNLLRAVLISAMSDLKKGGMQARQARDFFMSRKEDYIFSFQAICDQLDLDPKLVLMVTGLYPKRNTEAGLVSQRKEQIDASEPEQEA